jgi:putative heme-binding domain-containing protein
MSRRCRRLLFAFFLVFVAIAPCSKSASADDQPTDKVQIKEGDHISIIGNTLADRLQHDGWLEAFFQSRFPNHHLVIRNLGFSGDELTLRLRSAGFGSPDDHLSKNKSDIVFAFFGYNESFAGTAGLSKFKKDLEDFIDHTVKQRYNGKTSPRLVLFSPIAHEDLHNRDLPDGSENNRRLELYTGAMEEVARERRVAFVDLFHPTLKLYGTTEPLTINGVHLNEQGNRLLAEIIDRSLFRAGPEVKREPQALEKLRQAVLEKNHLWFNRYRTVDGYSIYGGRADLTFVGGQTNRVVAQREMEILDVMAANRDQRIWAAAQGKELTVDDSNTAAFVPVKTNKPGQGPNGEHLFLGGEEAIKQMTLAKGFKINLFASEKEFPELAKPVQMQFDAKGRLWVAAWPSYPHWKPKEEMNDKLLILEDTDGDGKADKCTVFADHLHCPTGFAFANGGVLLAQAPDLMFLQDSKGGDNADTRKRVLSGLDSADTHHTSNSFALDPGGAVYFQEGTFHHTQVETPYGPPVRCANAGVFRYEPRTQKFDVYVSHPFANPHGHVFDRWGQDFVYDGTGSNPYHGALFSGHVDYPNKHATPPQVYGQRTRPCPGVEILSSRNFPEENQGNLLVGNVIGFQGILQYKVEDKGASFTAHEVEPVVFSSDANFRPADIKIGPDGAIYFLDWQNPIIGHMQHNLRDPSRDRTHGRIYRITYEGRPLLKPAKIAGEPIEHLLDLLKEPEDRVRGLARIELGTRPTDELIGTLPQWIERLDKSEPAYEHHLLEALWVEQYHNAVDPQLLKRMLKSPDFRARAAATRVLCYAREKVPESLDLLTQLAADAHPRVRLEAVRAASFFTTPDAVQIPIISAGYPTDVYLDFVRGETMKTLQPYLHDALAAGLDVRLPSEEGTRWFLHSLKTDDLLKMKRNRDVYMEILLRRGMRDEQRQEAAAELAKLQHKDAPAAFLEACGMLDRQRSADDKSAMFDLVRLLTGQPAAQLARLRPELEKMAIGGQQPVSRQLGFVSLIAADGNVEMAWNLASRETSSLGDLVDAMPLIRDPNLRASLYPRIEPLLERLPDGKSTSPASLRHSVMNALTFVRGKETATFTALVPYASKDADRRDAIRALQRIPSSYWPVDVAKPLLESVLGYLRRTPAKERSKPAAADALQFGYALAALLPADQSRPARKELGALGVPIIRLGTLPDQMLFDRERIVVQAGKPVAIVFENNDMMPHNFVITQPGSLEEIGLLAEATASRPGAQERDYVPVSSKAILASRLLQPRNTQKLDFTAPATPGVYPYVCTYPGHWRRMFGALYVVADLDGYLEEPEGYLARNKVLAADPLLKLNRPRKEWKWEELAPEVEHLASGRSFNNGKSLFQAATCSSCHRLNGVGQEFGPDLTKLDPKQQSPAEILRDILEPSLRINEKYCTYVFEMESGKQITGLILEETPATVKVIENPLAKAEPVILKRTDIAERKKSATSIMPKGLLDKLTRDEILDLISYVAAGGNPNHPLFQGEGHHH